MNCLEQVHGNSHLLGVMHLRLITIIALYAWSLLDPLDMSPYVDVSSPPSSPIAFILVADIGPLGTPIYIFLGHPRDRLLRSLVNLLNKHFGLAQVRRMSRAALFHMRLGARCEHLLHCRRNSLVVLADEVGGWNIAPGGTGELGSLHQT